MSTPSTTLDTPYDTASLKLRNAFLQTQLSAASSENRKLNQDCLRERAENSKLSATITQLCDQLLWYKSDVELKAKANVGLASKISTLSTQITCLEGQLQAQAGIIFSLTQRLREEKTDADRKLEHLRQQVNDLKSEIKTLEADLAIANSPSPMSTTSLTPPPASTQPVSPVPFFELDEILSPDTKTSLPLVHRAPGSPTPERTTFSDEIAEMLRKGKLTVGGPTT